MVRIASIPQVGINGESFVTLAVYQAEHRIYNPIVINLFLTHSIFEIHDPCKVYSKLHKLMGGLAIHSHPQQVDTWPPTVLGH